MIAKGKLVGRQYHKQAGKLLSVVFTTHFVFVFFGSPFPHILSVDTHGSLEEYMFQSLWVYGQ